MKTSVRTPSTQGTSANLIYDLMRYSGHRLVLSAGYLSWFDALPFNEIANSVSEIDLVVGTWQGANSQATATALAALQKMCDDFATRVAQEATEYGLQKPLVRTFLVPNWHAKVAMMVDAAGISVSAAVIGSSNISAPALGLFMPGSNVEADVLIEHEDGPDAKTELKLLLMHLEPTFIPYLYKIY